jgi:hypothetical protein
MRSDSYLLRYDKRATIDSQLLEAVHRYEAVDSQRSYYLGAGVSGGEQLAELAEPRLIMPPAGDRGGVDRLARLPHAHGRHRSLVALGLEAGIVPIETSEGDQPPRDRLTVCDQVLVVDVNKAIGRQRRAPVLHQPDVLPIGESQIRFVADILDPFGEIRKVYREAGVDRVAAAMDDVHLGEQKMDQPQPVEIEWQLVGDPGRLRPYPIRPG